jgi:flavin reductase (DIM6/NTAB) family NADH-FMN oxidoreductase RutF
MPATTDFTQREFRDALGTFATGVTVVTACNEAGVRVGLTVSSFNSVSLDPPLVLWSLANTAHTMAVFQACSHYAVHVLAADQLALANQFAQRGIDRFAGVTCTTGETGVPLIDGALATFECRNRSQHAEGDHVIFVGEVVHCHRPRHTAPLLYHGGQLYDKHMLGDQPFSC